MINFSKFMLVLIFSYSLGAIPFGFLITKLITGKDIRTLGSGNIGATNVSRSVGKKWGRIVLLLDIMKGLMPPVIAFLLGMDEKIVIVSAFVAVIGHIFPVYIDFKGGKGVATGIGALIGVSIAYHVVAIGVLAFILTWFVVHRIFGFVSLASIAGALVFSIYGLLCFKDIWLKMFALGIGFFVVFRHRSNIIKLLKGEEVKSSL